MYEQLELERRKRLYAWPEKVGIDEHLFKHDFRLNQRRFVTMVHAEKGDTIRIISARRPTSRERAEYEADA